MLLDKITPVDVHIAQKLRQFRVASAMTQEQLGDLIGVTFQQVQKYEKAQNRVSASKLFEISQILNKPVSAFFAGVKADRDYYNYDFKSDKKQMKEVAEFNKEILPLIRAFNSIEDMQAKKHLVALASSIAKQKPKRVKHSYS